MTVLDVSALPWASKFRSMITVGAPDECWLWTGSGSAANGFGYFCVDGKRVVAMRVAWRLYHGEIPPGLMVLHSCRSKLCLNPSHLFLGTQKDRLPPIKALVACQGCGKEVMRGPSVRRFAKCSECIRKDQAVHDAQRMVILRQQARRLRIVMHVLGWGADQFDEMLAEMKRSPQAFRTGPEGRLATLDLTWEAKAKREEGRKRKRLLEAYAEGVEMAELIERFGMDGTNINQIAVRAGVKRPPDFQGTRGAA